MKDENKKITDDMITHILYKLTIISYIKQGEKLYCDDSNISIDHSYIPSLSRFFSNQNRDITLETVKEVIDKAIEITDLVYRNEISLKKNQKEKDCRQLKQFFRENNDTILKKFLIKLTCVIDGLNNLKLTYNEDKKIKTMLELEINRVNSRINKLENIFIIAV